MMSVTLVSKMELLIKETLIFKMKSDSKEVLSMGLVIKMIIGKITLDTETDLQSDQEIVTLQLEDEANLSKIIKTFMST